MRNFLITIFYVLTVTTLQANPYTAGDGAGLAILVIGDEAPMEVQGECFDWDFEKPYEVDAPFSVAVHVLFDDEQGTRIVGLLNGLINVGVAFWKLQLVGDITQVETGYSFSAEASDLRNPDGEPVLSTVEVTCTASQ